jgi:hypothetical protein
MDHFKDFILILLDSINGIYRQKSIILILATTFISYSPELGS